MSSREELFRNAKKTRADNKGVTQRGGGQQFENNLPQEPVFNTALAIKIPGTEVEPQSFKQVRLLGNPIDSRNDDPFSPRLIYSSLITGDDGKKFRCVWPDSPQNDKDFILSKILNRVMSFTYNREKQRRDYHYQDSHPELFNRVSKNGDISNPYESGWYPKSSVLMNVIDRDEMDWHRENGSTVLLSRRGTKQDNGNIFYEPGFPITIYNLVWDGIVEWAGDWETYDIVIERLSKEPWYRVYHPIENRRTLEGLGFSPYEDTAERELTNEESSWSRINLDEVFHPTTYIKIENRLGEFIKKVDAEMSTYFYDELKEKAENQRKELEKLQKEAESHVTDVSVDDLKEDKHEKESNSETTTEDQPSEKPVRRRKSTPSEENKPFNLDDYADKFVGVSKLTPDERATIIGFNENEQAFEYAQEDNSPLLVCENDDCNMLSPDWFSHCPGCGVEFSMEE